MEDNDEDEDQTPWDDMKSNDWGDTQDIVEDKRENFSSPSPPPPQPTTTTTMTKKPSNATTSWTQDKPSQAKNDWDSDAFFNDVLSSSTKPKLKTTRP
jgi:hypothetical protein